MRPRHAPWFSAALTVCVVGLVANLVTYLRSARPAQRSFGDLAGFLLPFVVFVIVVFFVRHRTRPAVAALILALCAVALSCYWATMPFKEFNGLMALVILPVQFILAVIPGVMGLVSGAPPGRRGGERSRRDPVNGSSRR